MPGERWQNLNIGGDALPDEEKKEKIILVSEEDMKVVQDAAVKKANLKYALEEAQRDYDRIVLTKVILPMYRSGVKVVSHYSKTIMHDDNMFGERLIGHAYELDLTLEYNDVIDQAIKALFMEKWHRSYVLDGVELQFGRIEKNPGEFEARIEIGMIFSEKNINDDKERERLVKGTQCRLTDWFWKWGQVKFTFSEKKEE